MIQRNLVDVLALLASIEARDETSALVARLEVRHETRCEEATSPCAQRADVSRPHPVRAHFLCKPINFFHH